MKKFRSFLMFAMMATLSATMVACGGDDEPGNEKPAPKPTVSDYNFASTTAMGYYYGDSFNFGRDLHYIIMLDKAEEPTKMLYLQLLSTEGKYGDGIPAGDYTLLLPTQINEAAKRGTLADKVAIAGSSNNGTPIYCYYTDIQGNIVLLKEGTVSVKRDGESYKVDITGAKGVLATVENGRDVTLSATFTGAIEESNYANSYTINFPASTVGQLISFGDYYGEGLGLWQLTLAPQGMAGEGFRIEFLTGSTSASADISGTYMAGRWNDDGSLEAGAGMFIPGLTDDKGIYGTYYLQVDANGQRTAYDLAVGGKITISKSGSNYTVQIEAVDNAANPQTLVGTWSGPLEVQVQ